MIYSSCDLIEHGLDFACNAITFCCRTTKDGGGFKTLIDNYHGEPLDLKEFFALKRKYRTMMKNNIEIPECKNCIYIEENDYDDEDYISSINFNQGLNCNLRCVYCTFTHGEKTEEPEYDVYPVIKQLSDEGYLRKGGFITIAGGEPTLYKNFSKLLYLLLDNDLSPIRILTNGVKYSEAIEEGIRRNNVNIMVSTDAGSPDMYKWIKGADIFYDVWENIKRYASVQNFPNRVTAKYIIIPEINDEKDEIIKFLDRCVWANIKTAAFDIEMTWFLENKENIPQKLYDIVEFTVEETEKRGLCYEPVDRVVPVLQEIKKNKELHISFRGHEI